MGGWGRGSTAAPELEESALPNAQKFKPFKLFNPFAPDQRRRCSAQYPQKFTTFSTFSIVAMFAMFAKFANLNPTLE